MKLKRVPGIECFMADPLNPRQKRLPRDNPNALYGLLRRFKSQPSGSPVFARSKWVRTSRAAYEWSFDSDIC